MSPKPVYKSYLIEYIDKRGKYRGFIHSLTDNDLSYINLINLKRDPEQRYQVRPVYEEPFGGFNPGETVYFKNEPHPENKLNWFFVVGYAIEAAGTKRLLIENLAPSVRWVDPEDIVRRD